MGSVSGTVTVGGKPLAAGAVTFHPVGGTGPTAVGTVTDGRYTLKVGTDARLPPGEYKVTVVGYGPLPAWDETKGGTPPVAEPITPTNYGELDRTPLTKTVTAGAQTIDLDVPAE